MSRSKRTPPVRVLSVCGKTSDLCSIVVKDATGNCMTEYSGYVPDFFPDEHCGDYLMLDIDVVTGRILNWPKDLTQDTLRAQLIELE